jgi:predicted aminopeptidase
VSESYQSKRERWQRLLESLPAELRDHVSLRNVEAVAALPPRAQEQLAGAIRSGLKRLPRAIEQLRANPNASVSELLNAPVQVASIESSAFPQQIQEELTGLIQLCFPDMPRLAAEALADADVMDVVRRTAQVHQDVFASGHLRTDFVIVILYTLVRQTLERLDRIVAEHPALQQAFHQRDLPWKPNDWSEQDAQKNR